MSKSRALANREAKKKPTEYRYGRGGRQTTTDLRVAELGKIDPTYYMPSGKSGSLKVQNMRKKQQKNSAITGSTESAYEKAFGRKKR